MQKQSTAEDVFTQAASFENGARVLFDEAIRLAQQSGAERIVVTNDMKIEYAVACNSRSSMPFTVAATCEVFAVELYLKAICRIEGIVYAKGGKAGHDLGELFKLLPSKWKDSIAVKFLDECKRLSQSHLSAEHFPTDIEQCLSQASESFQRFRYAFEYPEPVHYVRQARRAIRAAIMESQPTWVGISPW